MVGREVIRSHKAVMFCKIAGVDLNTLCKEEITTLQALRFKVMPSTTVHLMRAILPIVSCSAKSLQDASAQFLHSKVEELLLRQVMHFDQVVFLDQLTLTLNAIDIAMEVFSIRNGLEHRSLKQAITTHIQECGALMQTITT